MRFFDDEWRRWAKPSRSWDSRLSRGFRLSQRVSFGGDRGFAGSSYDPIVQIPVLVEEQGGDGAHAQLLGDGRVFVDVKLGDFELAGVFASDFFDDGANLHARATPGRPKVHES